MSFFAVIGGIICVGMALLEAFETVILPRSVKRPVRLTSAFFELSSVVYHAFGRMRPGPRRQSLLNSYAPLLILTLIILWAALLVVGFALIHWGLHLSFSDPEMGNHFIRNLYFSGVTFFTLGYGDVVPRTDLGRALATLEAGLGFGFLAVVIGYVPVFYSAFSKREVGIVMLDTRAGSHPTGLEILCRHASAGVYEELVRTLRSGEQFAAELLESFLSYPLLAYYRSQHDDQSWLRSLVAFMDACAMIEVGFTVPVENEAALRFQARSTFAMARHVLVDLAYVLGTPPVECEARMTDAEYAIIRERLEACGIPLRDDATTREHLTQLRQIYEPYARALSDELILDLPAWGTPPEVDHWQTSAWEGIRHF